jgi:hypothetical protein
MRTPHALLSVLLLSVVASSRRFNCSHGLSPTHPPGRLTLAERITQIQDEIRAEGWEGLTKERPLSLP